jgi:hypothetical protein
MLVPSSFFRVLWRRAPLTLAGLLSLTSCSSDEGPTFTLQVGPAQVMKFTARSAFAHYYELPGQEDVLRIIVASYPLGCHEYREPEPGEVFATVTLRVPVNENVEAGTYAWTGLPKKEEAPLEGEAAAPPVPAAAEAPPEPPPEGAGEEKDEKLLRPLPGYAIPFVRLAQDARPLPPGGSLKLAKLERQPFGQVQGEFQFRDGGDGEAATAALMGEFSVRLCHISLDSARATIATE